VKWNIGVVSVLRKCAAFADLDYLLSYIASAWALVGNVDSD
jgi:hypothetical protein